MGTGEVVKSERRLERVEMSSSASVFSLYRNLLRQGRSFNSYQFSHYVIRRTKDEFRRHAGESDPMVIKELLKKGEQDLVVVHRQSQISQLYPRKNNVLEA